MFQTGKSKQVHLRWKTNPNNVIFPFKRLSFNTQTQFVMVRYFIFITSFFCNLWSGAAAQSIDSLFVRTAYSKLQAAREYTIQVATAMPAQDYSFKPDPDEMTFGEQLLHLSQNLGWL